jgi:hypothetical protein
MHERRSVQLKKTKRGVHIAEKCTAPDSTSNHVCGIIALKGETSSRVGSTMSRVVKRSASQVVKAGPSRRGATLPGFIPPQLSHPVEKPPSGPQWLHEIKLDGYHMADSLLRHTVYVGLREDKPAELVRRSSIGPRKYGLWRYWGDPIRPGLSPPPSSERFITTWWPLNVSDEPLFRP